MRTLILKKILLQHGFKQEDVAFFEDRVRFKIKDVNQQELREEGAPIPGKNDSSYHNYIYSDGFISNLDKIEVTYYPEGHQYHKRINTIRIPLSMYKDTGETANAIHDTNHTIKKNADSVLITVDYSNKNGTTPANQLLNQLISDLQPRIASSDDISQGLNYISDMGRLLPLIGLGIQREVREMFLQGSKNGHLLQLQDRIVNSPDQVQDRFIDIDIGILYSYIEKLVREEGYLAQLVRNYLQLDQKNWIFADQDLLNNFTKNKDANSEKLKLALQNKAEPLFISTTTGNHAFAVKVDFQSNTLFLANPGEDTRNCEAIIEQLKQITGCTNFVRVITQKLKREEDIPFNDVCTVDSLALAQMMMDQPLLSEGCLNSMPLKTGVYVKNALSEIDKIDEMDLELPPHQPSVSTDIPLKTASIPENPHTLEKNSVPEDEFHTSPQEEQSFRYGVKLLNVTEDEEVIVRRPPSAFSNLSMQILGGFITVLGVAAIATAFAALNAATFGIGGLVLAGIGIAATLAGIGLFAAGSIRKGENVPPTIEQPLAVL
ncbi:hypothetical protein [Legionella maioricensis]|uniref:Uncharacterized protein n=1 Tax=Legionella maioricensis TaxID=2896528 RepID=A0A9X2IBG0_9GAMM|nr:hypothetical protein [Legionella maioricensis]MCL9684410.1 hypothetical protein [Legionella maioricensis]MCL9687591.1 hypothetical protein [Legionella maioricensis]